jgi:uracil DNA glycosylase
MVFLGGRAREYMEFVDHLKSDVLCFSHPSPRGAYSGHNPFMGSHMFTTINDRLVGEGLEPIDWRL